MKNDLDNFNAVNPKTYYATINSYECFVILCGHSIYSDFQNTPVKHPRTEYYVARAILD